MFDVGFWEIAIVAVVALIVVGPERLPPLARTVGLWVGKARRMVADVKSDIDREVRESEFSEVKNIGNQITEARNKVQSSSEEFLDVGGMDEVADSIKESAQAIDSDKPGTI